MKKIIILTLVLISIFGFIYFHPTSEILNCNNNFNCKVVRTYFVMKWEYPIYINSKSELSIKTHYNPFSRCGRYYGHLIIKNHDKNTVPFIEEFEPRCLSSECQVNYFTTTDFNNYINHRTASFHIKSCASNSIYEIIFLYVFIALIGIIILFFKDKILKKS